MATDHSNSLTKKAAPARRRRAPAAGAPRSNNVLPFRRPEKPGRAEPTEEEYVHGTIQIVSTDKGDAIEISGAYVNRLEHGMYVALRLLNMFVDKIAEGNCAGYSTSPPIAMSIPPKSGGPNV